MKIKTSQVSISKITRSLWTVIAGILRLIRFGSANQKTDRLPIISESIILNYFKPLTAPNPDITVHINNHDGERVGTITYAISPINDTVYIYDIKIEREWRRKGYGLAILHSIHKKYSLPITPVHQTEVSRGFWDSVRRLKSIGLILTDDISCQDMLDEKNRWLHLEPEILELESIISARMQFEEWGHATGRGVD